jgi:glutaconate CoA-transferase subunit A
VISAVCAVPQGAHPSYALGYYKRDNAFYTAWDDIARERDGFRAWIDEFVLGTKDHAEFMARFRGAPPVAQPGAQQAVQHG